MPQLSNAPIHKLESELLEEPLVVASLVLLLEDLLNSLLGIDALAGLVEGLLGDSRLEAVVVEAVAGRHDVLVVDALDEGLDLGAARDLFLGVLTGNLLRVTLDAYHESVAVGVRLRALVEGLDDDDLLTGLTAASNDGNLVGLQELGHCIWCMCCYVGF